MDADANANVNADAGGSTIALRELCSGELKTKLKNEISPFAIPKRSSPISTPMQSLKFTQIRERNQSAVRRTDGRTYRRTDGRYSNGSKDIILYPATYMWRGITNRNKSPVLERSVNILGVVGVGGGLKRLYARATNFEC